MSRTQEWADSPAGPAGITIRPACASDAAALASFFAGLSARSRYMRFFAPVTPTQAMIRALTGGGGRHALVATRDGMVIGHGMAADRAGLESTEIGVVVTDGWQGRGVGSALVRALVTAAGARGVTTITMDVLPGNRRVLAMIARKWPAARLHLGPDCVTARVWQGAPRRAGRAAPRCAPAAPRRPAAGESAAARAA